MRTSGPPIYIFCTRIYYVSLIDICPVRPGEDNRLGVVHRRDDAYTTNVSTMPIVRRVRSVVCFTCFQSDYKSTDNSTRTAFVGVLIILFVCLLPTKPTGPSKCSIHTQRLPVETAVVCYNCNIYELYTCRAALKCPVRIFKSHKRMPLVFLVFHVYAHSYLVIVVIGIYHFWGGGERSVPSFGRLR